MPSTLTITPETDFTNATTCVRVDDIETQRYASCKRNNDSATDAPCAKRICSTPGAATSTITRTTTASATTFIRQKRRSSSDIAVPSSKKEET